MATAGSSGVGRPANSIRAAVDRITRVPSRFRRYDQTAATARSAHGISTPLLEALLDNGMPHQSAHGALLFDALDLANASFHLALPSAHSMALRGWVSALRAASEATAVAYSISFRAQCPQPGHPGECTLTQPPQVTSVIGRSTGDFPPAEFSASFTANTASIMLPPLFRELTAELAEVEYHLLPNELHEDIGFLKHSGLADCPLATEFLLRVGSSRGYVVRKSFGILVSMPFSVPHFWVDLNIDGEWHAVDPHLLRMLSVRKLVDPDIWPAYRTLGGAAWRIADRDLPLALHNGHEIPCSLPTRRLPADLAPRP